MAYRLSVRILYGDDCHAVGRRERRAGQDGRNLLLVLHMRTALPATDQNGIRRPDWFAHNDKAPAPARPIASAPIRRYAPHGVDLGSEEGQSHRVGSIPT